MPLKACLYEEKKNIDQKRYKKILEGRNAPILEGGPSGKREIPGAFDRARLSGCEFGHDPIDGRTAHLHVARNLCRCFPRRMASRNFAAVDRRLAAFVDAPLLFGLHDTFTLTLADQGALKFSDGAHEVQLQADERIVCRCAEYQPFGDELDRDPFAVQLRDQILQVFQRPRQTVDRPDRHHVTFTNERDHLFQLRAVGGRAAGLVLERPFNVRDILAVGVLFRAGYARVSNSHVGAFLLHMILSPFSKL